MSDSLTLVASTASRRRFSVADFHRMAEAGILTEDDRVELIDGDVRDMTPIGPRHVAVVSRLTRLLAGHLAEELTLSPQNPTRLSDQSEPRPDFAILRPRADRYETALPEASDALLVIEVGDTSIEYDRWEKVPRYARAGIPEVWLVDLTGDVVEQYTGPREGQYEQKRTLKRGQAIDAEAVTLSLLVDDILS